MNSSCNINRIDKDYIGYIEKYPNTYDNIFETIKVLKMGITLSDLSFQLDIPKKIVYQCLIIIKNGWNTFFSKGRIIYNAKDSKYYYLNPSNPIARDRNPKIFVY